ncbi:hypothetical protein HDU97_004373 [Phlyctochytrium planicorne]|nr:hypothetical protein HDU97_004373 [Phlyctochytrium planicorne]
MPSPSTSPLPTIASSEHPNRIQPSSAKPDMHLPNRKGSIGLGDRPAAIGSPEPNQMNSSTGNSIFWVEGSVAGIHPISILVDRKMPRTRVSYAFAERAGLATHIHSIPKQRVKVLIAHDLHITLSGRTTLQTALVAPDAIESADIVLGAPWCKAVNMVIVNKADGSGVKHVVIDGSQGRSKVNIAAPPAWWTPEHHQHVNSLEECMQSAALGPLANPRGSGIHRSSLRSMGSKDEYGHRSSVGSTVAHLRSGSPMGGRHGSTRATSVSPTHLMIPASPPLSISSFDNAEVDSQSPSPKARTPESPEDYNPVVASVASLPSKIPSLPLPPSLSSSRSFSLPAPPRLQTNASTHFRTHSIGDRVLGAKPVARHLWTSINYDQLESPVTPTAATPTGSRRLSHDGSLSVSSPKMVRPPNSRSNESLRHGRDIEEDEDGEDEDGKLWESVWAKHSGRQSMSPPPRVLQSSRTFPGSGPININSVSPSHSPSPTPSGFSVSMSPSPAPSFASSQYVPSPSMSRQASASATQKRMAWNGMQDASDSASDLYHSHLKSLQDFRRSSVDSGEMQWTSRSSDEYVSSGRPLSVAIQAGSGSSHSLFPSASSVSSTTTSSHSGGGFLGIRFKSKRHLINNQVSNQFGSPANTTVEPAEETSSRSSHRLSGVFGLGSSERASSLPRSLNPRQPTSPTFGNTIKKNILSAQS